MSTGDPFGAGDTSTLPEHRSGAETVRARNLRRVGLTVAWLLIAVALTGFLGVRMVTADVSAQGWTLRVELLKTERLTIDDVREAARQQGIRSFADVDLAVLEPSGAISFFQRQEDRDSGAPETAGPGVT